MLTGQPRLIGLLTQAIGDALRNLLGPLRVRINQEDGEIRRAVTRGNIGCRQFSFITRARRRRARLPARWPSRS